VSQSQQSFVHTAARGLLISALLVLSVGLISGQNPVPAKEYIRLGGRVIAIENPAVTVTVNASAPVRTAIAYGEAEQFNATVNGNTDQAVTWAPPSAGLITSSGDYSAPTTYQSSSTQVTIAASSVAVPSATGTFSLTIYPAFYPATAQVPATGVTNASVQVTQGGSWTASTSLSWIHIVSPSSGSGNQALVYTVDPNGGGVRSGEISMSTSIGTQSLTISQAAGSGVSVTQSPAGTISSNGATLTFTVTGGSSSWGWTTSPSNPPNMIAVTSCTCGGSNGTVVVQIPPNTSSSQLIGYITIAGETMSITQSGAGTTTISANCTGCTTTGTNSYAVTVSSAASSVPVSVMVTNGPLSSAWTVSYPSWITASCTACSTGSGQVLLTIAPNLGSSPLQGTVTIAAAGASGSPQTITVNQPVGTLSITVPYPSLTWGGMEQVSASLSGEAVQVNWSLAQGSPLGSLGGNGYNPQNLTAGPSTSVEFYANTTDLNEGTATITAAMPNSTISASTMIQVNTATQAWVLPSSSVSVAGQEQVCSSTISCSTYLNVAIQFSSGQYSSNPPYYPEEFTPGAELLITSNPAGSDGYPPYLPAQNSCLIWLINDGQWIYGLENEAGSGDQWAYIGQADPSSTPQCTLDTESFTGANPNVNPTGFYANSNGQVILDVGVIFNSSFAGTKSVWMQLQSTSPYPTTNCGSCINFPWTNLGSITILAPANITTTVGTPQSTGTSQAFGSLAVSVTDASGTAIPNAAVTFAPTTSAGGATATFAGGATSATVNTNASGIATAPALTANNKSGSYSVAASVPAITTPVSFSLSNYGPAQTITATAGANQNATVNTAFPIALQATVTDAGGIPVPNFTVTFTATQGVIPTAVFSGSLATITAVTNANGIATAPLLTANYLAGSYNVTAGATGVTSATFPLTNVAGAPATIIESLVGDLQNAVINTSFTKPLQATIQDAVLNPVNGAPVTFTILDNGAGATFSGGNTAVTISTNASGLAVSPTLTANGQTGWFTVKATTPGVTSEAKYSLNNIPGLPASITATAGTPQSAMVGTAFATALQATVTSSGGSPVSNEPVTFTVSSSGQQSATFSGGATTAVAYTNTSGVATPPALTANSMSGSYSVTASVPPVATSANFILTNYSTAAKIVATAGASQNATVSTPFATALQATVTDASGTPVSGATVTFAVPASGASAIMNGSASAITNINGIATSSLLTANTQAGSFTVTASVSGASTPASFAMVNLAGAPANILASAGTVQSTGVNSAFATALQATVHDAYGNALSGTAVAFTVQGTGAGASFSSGSTAITVSTNSSGVATASTLTANSHSGAFTVAATVSGVSAPAYFNLTNIGPPAYIAATSGSGQSAIVVGAFLIPTFSAPLQATVTDSSGNPVSNASVTFTAPSTGPSAAFSGSLTATVSTNSSGVATSPTLTGNSTAGNYNIVASVSGVSATASFSLSNQSIVITPSGTLWLLPGQSLQFTATVTGLSNTAVIWQGGGTGTFTSNGNSGTYTAPSSVTGSYVAYLVIPTSQADSSLYTGDIILISAPPTMVQSPLITGSGPYYNFSATGNDPNGAGSIGLLKMGFTPVGGGTTKCVVVYTASTASFSLVDAGDTAGPLPAGSSGSIQNTTCVLTNPTVTVSSNGNQETMNLPISFVDTNTSFAGNYDVIGYVEDGPSGFNSGWKGIGTWTVSYSTQAPSNASLTPASGSGTSQTFVAAYADPNGVGNVFSALLDIVQSGSSVCEVYYTTANNSFYLLSQPGNVESAALVAGASGSIQDSECTLTAPSVSYSGDQLILTAPIAFNSSFTGTMGVYMWVKDVNGVNSGSVKMGTWTVP
jgi:hypothetical protein